MIKKPDLSRYATSSKAPTKVSAAPRKAPATTPQARPAATVKKAPVASQKALGTKGTICRNVPGGRICRNVD